MGSAPQLKAGADEILTLGKFSHPIQLPIPSAIQPTDHDTRMLACEFASRLTYIQRYVSRSLPESTHNLVLDYDIKKRNGIPEKLRGKTIRYTEIIQVLGFTLR